MTAKRVVIRVSEYIYRRVRISVMIWRYGRIQRPSIITDPYCPAIRAVTSKDAPFVVKSSEELPARRKVRVA